MSHLGPPNADLTALLARFSGARVAVVGDLAADEYVEGETDRVSREAPVLIVRWERTELKPGCAANVVSNLCALGATVRPVGLLGDDPAGAALRAILSSAGADLSCVRVAAGRPTACKTRILAGGRNTRRQQIVRLDKDGPGGPTPDLLPSLRAALAEAARGADAVVVSDYGLGLAPALRPELLALARGLPLCVDARAGLASWTGAALAKPNEVELDQALGRRVAGDEAALEAAGHALRAQMAARALLVTRGRTGMALFEEGAPMRLLPAHGGHEAVDVTGAGDTVLSAMALGLACGASPAQAARLANVAGGLKVRKPGPAPVPAAELSAELLRAEVASPLPARPA